METWQSYYSRVLSSDQTSEFIPTMSYELRRPFTSIRGTLGLLRDGTINPLSAKGKRLLDIAVTDIDRLVHLTTVLEQERDRFFTLSPDLLCISGFDGYFQRLNPSWEKTLGFTPAELMAEPYIKFVHPEDQEVTRTASRQLFFGSQSISLENRYLCKDGSYKWFLWHIVRYPKEQLIYAVGRDITKRKQTEEALCRSEERFRSLVSSLPGAIYRCGFDADWTIDFISEAIADISGYPASDFIQNKVRSFASIIHPEDSRYVERIILQTVALHIPYILEYRIIRADGSVRWVAEKGQGIFDENGQVIYLEGAIFDITEGKQAEWRLGVQHATNRVLTEADTPNKFMPKILQALCESLGWKLGEFWKVTRDNVLCCKEIWHEPTVQVSEFKAVTQEITLALGIDLPGRIWANSTPHWVADVVQDNNCLRAAIAHKEELHAAFGFPVISGNEILGVLTFFSKDIHPPDEDLLKMMIAIGKQIGQFIERKRAKEALEQSEAQLKEQTTQLQHALQELKHTQAQLVQSEKMSGLGQLVAGIAHEINNPINFIHGNIDYTNQYAQSLLHLLALYAKHYPIPVAEIQAEAEAIDLGFIIEDLPKLLASMKMGTKRIHDIVLSLRNFSRLDEAQKKRVNIHTGIDSTLLILQSRITAKAKRPAIEIIKEYGNLPLVECYPGTLNQVLMNILNNAIDVLEEEE